MFSVRQVFCRHSPTDCQSTGIRRNLNKRSQRLHDTRKRSLRFWESEEGFCSGCYAHKIVNVKRARAFRAEQMLCPITNNNVRHAMHVAQTAESNDAICNNICICNHPSPKTTTQTNKQTKPHPTPRSFILYTYI